jgi:hypothetical protein
MVIRPDLTGISISIFLEHHTTLTMISHEIVGDIFERGVRSIFYFSSHTSP